MNQKNIDSSIFRAYDIRGVVGSSLTLEATFSIGLAFGTESQERGHATCVLGGDVRPSTPAIREAMLDGLSKSGLNTIDIGTVTTPMMYFASRQLGTGAGLMITGSHNPPEYNGIKLVLNSQALTANDIQALRQRIESGSFQKGNGAVTHTNIADIYAKRITEDIQLIRPLRIAADFGNGCAGINTPMLLERLGCELIPLYENPDGAFPNHHPDPTRPENLASLIKAVKSSRCDLGVAFDGDGDRLGVVDDQGRLIWPDRLLMLFANHILAKTEANKHIVFDVKCSALLGQVIKSCGGVPVMCRTGHSWLKARMAELGASLGGEFSGHICFADRWIGCDDATYATARLLEILSASTDAASTLFDQFPSWITEPELLIPVEETNKFQIIEELQGRASILGGCITDLDGLRADFADGWALVRASNTIPALSLRFEGQNLESLSRIRERILLTLLSVYPEADSFLHNR